VLSAARETLKPTRHGDVFSEGDVLIRPSPSRREFHPTDNLIILQTL
jgi:hypothetical protein